MASSLFAVMASDAVVKTAGLICQCFIYGELAMLAFKFTPTGRFALAVVAIGYVFSSHYLITGGWLLQVLTLLFGLGLTIVLIASIVPAMSDTSVDERSQEFLEKRAINSNTKKQSIIVDPVCPEVCK